MVISGRSIVHAPVLRVQQQEATRRSRGATTTLQLDMTVDPALADSTEEEAGADGDGKTPRGAAAAATSADLLETRMKAVNSTTSVSTNAPDSTPAAAAHAPDRGGGGTSTGAFPYHP